MPLDVVVEQLRALDDHLARPDAHGEDTRHRATISLARRYLRELATQVESQADRSRRDAERIAALRQGLERVRVSADRQAAHYEEAGFGEARTWRHLEHIAEQTLEDDAVAAEQDR